MITFKILRFPFVVCVPHTVHEFITDIILNITSQEDLILTVLHIGSRLFELLSKEVRVKKQPGRPLTGRTSLSTTIAIINVNVKLNIRHLNALQLLRCVTFCCYHFSVTNREVRGLHFEGPSAPYNVHCGICLIRTLEYTGIPCVNDKDTLSRDSVVDLCVCQPVHLLVARLIHQERPPYMGDHPFCHTPCRHLPHKNVRSGNKTGINFPTIVATTLISFALPYCIASFGGVSFSHSQMCDPTRRKTCRTHYFFSK